MPVTQHESGRWRWAMTASAPPGIAPFSVSGILDVRADAESKVVDTYERWDEWRTKPSYWDMRADRSFASEDRGGDVEAAPPEPDAAPAPAPSVPQREPRPADPPEKSTGFRWFGRRRKP